MLILILAPPEPSSLGDRRGKSIPEIVRQAVSRVGGAEQRWASNEEDLARELAHGADVLVFAAATVREWQIRQISALRPPPVIVVTDDPPLTALALRSVAVREIVEPHAEVVALAIRRCADAALLVRASRVAEAHPRYSQATRCWMALTLTARPPYGTVSAAAQDLGISANTIDVHWAEDVGCSRPKEWLGWIQLVRALEYRRGRTCWAQVAGQLSMPIRTLQRLARRRTMHPLSDLDGETFLAAAEQYFAATFSGR